MIICGDCTVNSRTPVAVPPSPFSQYFLTHYSPFISGHLPSRLSPSHTSPLPLLHPSRPSPLHCPPLPTPFYPAAPLSSLFFHPPSRPLTLKAVNLRFHTFTSTILSTITFRDLTCGSNVPGAQNIFIPPLECCRCCYCLPCFGDVTRWEHSK